MPLSLSNIDKTVGGEIHLKEIALDFDEGSRNVILGRTLAGKTSLLRILAGLDRPSRGKLLLNGKDITGISVRKRSVAMVYQQFINYPSMTIFDNIASPLKLSGMERSEIERRVRETAEMLHIDTLLGRLPAELSGGQQQRTAIARALVKDAELLLLDEPLVNLDYKLREELRIELQEIFARREAIVVYTTTEPSEALMLGGNIVVMDEGRILQTGPTPEVYHHPASLKVAEIFSDPPINYLKGTVADGMIRIGDQLELPLEGQMIRLTAGDYTFGIRSNHLFLKRQRETDAEIRGTVALSEINGSETFIHLQYRGSPLVVQEVGIFSQKMGREITVYANPERFFVFDSQGRLAASPVSAN